VKICTCVGCGAVFQREHLSSRNKGLYCTRACSGAARTRRTHARLVAERAARLRSIQCAECQGAFTRPLRSQRRTCSDLCRRLYLNRVAASAIKRKRHALYPEQSQTFTCQNIRCGKAFLHMFRTGVGNPKFCSLRCMKRAARRGRTHHEQRARRAGVPCDYSVNPLKVFARDRWRCQLCGCTTPKHRRGTTHSRAPELDHIVPISAGGGHTWDNVQCACRTCNIRKSGKVLGQLRLAV
jgi:hypothetical protein